MVDVPTGRSAEPQRVTITATSKLSQQTKLVRKALVEQQARVFELRAQGVEGLQRALRRVQQVCRDMRAQQRDLFVQPTRLCVSTEEEEEDVDDKAGARQQRQPAWPKHHTHQLWVLSKGRHLQMGHHQHCKPQATTQPTCHLIYLTQKI
ncbi:hypothetical protein PLESTM_000066400 [Pleodorina starrii]|nr:hypothetical protein PLESTM_000066400 [Pleodorina starrii]